MAAVKEARKSAWAGTGSAAISTANNGTSARSACDGPHKTKLMSSAPTHSRRGGSVVSWQGDSDAQSLVCTCCGISQRYNANLMHDSCFLTRRKTLVDFWSEFQFPAQLVARLVSSWRQSLDPNAGSIGGHTSCVSHTHTHTHVPSW